MKLAHLISKVTIDNDLNKFSIFTMHGRVSKYIRIKQHMRDFWVEEEAGNE